MTQWMYEKRKSLFIVGAACLMLLFLCILFAVSPCKSTVSYLKTTVRATNIISLAEIKEYKITFHASTDEVIAKFDNDTDTYLAYFDKDGDTIKETVIPTPNVITENYRFVGWTKVSGSNEVMDFSNADVITEDCDVWPVYEKTRNTTNTEGKKVKASQSNKNTNIMQGTSNASPQTENSADQPMSEDDVTTEEEINEQPQEVNTEILNSEPVMNPSSEPLNADGGNDSSPTQESIPPSVPPDGDIKLIEAP